VELRKKIEDKIRDNSGDYQQAALDICLVLEKEIGLSGNGWFDDDPVVTLSIIEKEL